MEAYPVIFCCHNILSLLLIYPAKGLHKGTSEAPVLPESGRKYRSKDSFILLRILQRFFHRDLLNLSIIKETDHCEGHHSDHKNLRIHGRSDVKYMDDFAIGRLINWDNTVMIAVAAM